MMGSCILDSPNVENICISSAFGMCEDVYDFCDAPLFDYYDHGVQFDTDLDYHHIASITFTMSVNSCSSTGVAYEN